MTTLSILLASKNQVHMIEDTIMHLKSQTFTDFEVIVVDGYSTDGTFEMCKRFPNVRLFQKDSSCEDAWEFALELAEGKYAMFATTSDYLPNRNYLEICIRTLEADPQLSMVWSSSYDVDETGQRVVGIWGQEKFYAPPPEKFSYLCYCMADGYLPELNYVVATDVLRKCVHDDRFGTRKFGLHMRINFAFIYLGYLQKYIPVFGHVGRRHTNQQGVIVEPRMNFEFRCIRRLKMKMIFDGLSRGGFIFRSRDHQVVGRANRIDLMLVLIKYPSRIFSKHVSVFFRRMLRALKI